MGQIAVARRDGRNSVEKSAARRHPRAAIERLAEADAFYRIAKDRRQDCGR
jgi:hypothetical protein